VRNSKITAITCDFELKNEQNAFSAGAPLQTPLGKLTALSNPLTGLLGLLIKKRKRKLLLRGHEKGGGKEVTPSSENSLKYAPSGIDAVLIVSVVRVGV